MAGLFKAIGRTSWGKNYGDTIFPGGPLAVTIEKGKCIAWLMGAKDHELSKNNVKKIELVDCGVTVNDYVDGSHKITQVVDIYKIEVARRDNTTFNATLRLIPSTKQKVLELITDGEPQRAVPATSANAKEGAPATSATAKEGAPAKPAAPAKRDNNPKDKPLEWFISEAGLESYKEYMTPQNYMLEDMYLPEFEKVNTKGDRYDGYSYRIFLDVYHKGATMPSVYFEALASAIDAQPLQIRGVLDYFIFILKLMAKPFCINEDGEPEACPPQLLPEELLSVEKNPLLNFVKNFDVFEIRDDALGAKGDKYELYLIVMKFLATSVATTKRETVIEENQWLFDKNTYLNDFGTVRKTKGFLKKCKELSNFPEYFDEEIARLDD